MSVKFMMGGSGLGGQGPGWIGGVCYKKAGEIVSLDPITSQNQIRLLMASSMATILPADYVEDPVEDLPVDQPSEPEAVEAVLDPRPSAEELKKAKMEEYAKKLKGMHISALRSELGLPGGSKMKKAEIIEELLKQASWASNG